MPTLLDPKKITVGDLCGEALFEAGVVAEGQEIVADQLTRAQFRLQMMLQQWPRKRYLIYHLVTLNCVSTGQVTPYTIGPGGQIDTGVGSVRPDKLEAAFLRQLTQSQPNQIDYPMELLQTMEDYSRIRLKQLTSFPGCAFLDAAWPLGNLYFWPVPSSAIYGIYVVVKEQLPQSFATQAATFTLPYETYAALMYSLALRLRSAYRIPPPVGDNLPTLVKDAMNTLRIANAAPQRLVIPPDLVRPGFYNIFSDRST